MGGVWPESAVEYLGEGQREQFRLTVVDGLIYDAAGELFDTSNADSESSDSEGRAIFVMDSEGNIYASTSHPRGEFHHSSFLSGEPVAAAGELFVINGELQRLTDSSGHYGPSRAYTLQFAHYLRNQGVQIASDQINFRAFY